MKDIINDWIKTYLIGPMEDTQADDEGRGWRNRLRPELEKRRDDNNNPIYIFDPTLEEQSKVGMNPREFHKKATSWLTSGHIDKFKEGANLIWKGKNYLEKTEDDGKAKLIHIMGDIDYVLKSHFLIAKMDKGDKPCGTFMEAGIALEHNIPIYVIQTMLLEEYPFSFKQAVFASGGEFFQNENKLLEFIDEKYNLKIKD